MSGYGNIFNVQRTTELYVNARVSSIARAMTPLSRPGTLGGNVKAKYGEEVLTAILDFVSSGL